MPDWSPQQEAIFEWFRAPKAQNLVVRARAGTGKTTTICEALTHIEWTIGAGERALVCAFNKRIAEELNRRLADVQKVEAKTLHSLGFMFLRNAWGNALKPDNQIEKERVNDAIVGRKPAQWEVITNTVRLVGFAKNGDPEISADALEELAIIRNLDVDVTGEYGADWMASVAWRAMHASLTPDPAGRISFDDMVYIPAALKLGMPLYDWVIVDEAQDMSAGQLIVASAALKPGGHMIVVGDDRQAIYGFRGADSDCLDRLKRELNADELGLTTTYRCPKSVVKEAQALVPDFYAAESAPDGQVIEGTWDDVLEKARPGDAILSRTNAPLVPLCLSFIKKQIPAKIEGREIGKLLADRAKKLKPMDMDDLSLKLARWANQATGRAIASGKNVDAKLQQIEDVRDTLEAVADGCETLTEFYTRCEALFADVASDASRCVLLSTVHKAKGLEWERVFVLSSTFRDGNREELNIKYVAVTRSKSALMLVGGHAAV